MTDTDILHQPTLSLIVVLSLVVLSSTSLPLFGETSRGSSNVGHEILLIMEVDKTHIRLPVLGATKSILLQSFTMKTTSFTFAKQEKVNKKSPILRGVGGSRGRRNTGDSDVIGKTKGLPCDTRTIPSDRRSDAYRRGAKVPLMVQIKVVGP